MVNAFVDQPLQPAILRAMGKPAAKSGDNVIGLDTHIVLVPSPAGPAPMPMPMPFSGQLVSELSDDVRVQNQPAAVQGSRATNLPPHVPAGGLFQKPPGNEGVVITGSQTVRINSRPAARDADTVATCNDPADAPNGTVRAVSTVRIGG